MRRVIIPAAGKASRIFGIPKELLPIDEGVTCLSKSIKLASTVGQPIVISNPIKLALHSYVVDVPIMLQKGDELWGAIKTGLQEGKDGGLILADTVTDFSVYDIDTEADLSFGTFLTNSSRRFSVLLENRIATKEDLPGTYDAWGVVLWSKRVTDFMLTLEDDHYDRIFERVIQRFGYSTFPLHYYKDLGTFDSYVDYIAEHHIHALDFGDY